MMKEPLKIRTFSASQLYTYSRNKQKLDFYTEISHCYIDGCYGLTIMNQSGEYEAIILGKSQIVYCDVDEDGKGWLVRNLYH